MRCHASNKIILLFSNAFSDSKYFGLQVYYSQNDEKSAGLAKAIQDNVKASLQPENERKIKAATDSIYLLHKAPCPAVMIECGFLSNAEECEKLSQKEYQKQLSFSIVCGIIEYITSNN